MKPRLAVGGSERSHIDSSRIGSKIYYLNVEKTKSNSRFRLKCSRNIKKSAPRTDSKRCIDGTAKAKQTETKKKRRPEQKIYNERHQTVRGSIGRRNQTRTKNKKGSTGAREQRSLRALRDAKNQDRATGPREKKKTTSKLSPGKTHPFLHIALFLLF